MRFLIWKINSSIGDGLIMIEVFFMFNYVYFYYGWTRLDGVLMKIGLNKKNSRILELWIRSVSG